MDAPALRLGWGRLRVTVHAGEPVLEDRAERLDDVELSEAAVSGGEIVPLDKRPSIGLNRTMRRRAWPFGLSGGIALVVGIVLDAALANKESQCAATGGTGGLLGLPPPPSPSNCGQSNLFSGVGLVLIVVGVLLLVAALVVALRRPT